MDELVGMNGSPLSPGDLVLLVYTNSDGTPSSHFPGIITGTSTKGDLAVVNVWIGRGHPQA